MAHRPLYQIAQDIRDDWQNPYFGVVPYINAMGALTTMRDYYEADSAQSIVAYFLANARTWKGAKAKEIKAELKSMLRTS